MKKIFQSELFWECIFGSIFWLISFSIISWLVDGSFWLHFFLTSSSSSTYFLTNSIRRQISEKMVPIFQNIDDNINSLFEHKNQLEEDLEELKNKINDIDSKIEEIEESKRPRHHDDSF